MKILIVGAGASGLACANALKDNDEVWLIDKDEEIGGLSRDFSCKATDTCNYCGWCLLDENMKEIRNNNQVKIVTKTYFKNVIRNGATFRVELGRVDQPDDSQTVEFDRIILANGGLHFDAKKKARFGYGRYPRVITGYDLEKQLRSFDCSTMSEIAFVQCVGSRDESINACYCSKICCRYAVRMANYLLYKYPDLKITIFYMDLQVQGEDINGVYENIKGKIHLVRGIPAYLEENAAKMKVRFEDQALGEMEGKDFDLVVLSVGIAPNPDNRLFSELLGVNLDQDGFIKTYDGIKTNIDGVWSIGVSSSPKGIKDSILCAKTAGVG
jgi:heterodisulfide reductase subunit A2